MRALAAGHVDAHDLLEAVPREPREQLARVSRIVHVAHPDAMRRPAGRVADERRPNRGRGRAARGGGRRGGGRRRVGVESGGFGGELALLGEALLLVRQGLLLIVCQGRERTGRRRLAAVVVLVSGSGRGLALLRVSGAGRGGSRRRSGSAVLALVGGGRGCDGREVGARGVNVLDAGELDGSRGRVVAGGRDGERVQALVVHACCYSVRERGE